MSRARRLSQRDLSPMDLSMPAPTKSRSPAADRCALLLMLAYVESECRRLGADAAARHAALAAELVPEPISAAELVN